MSEATLLLKWFKKNKRPLPWRSNKDPYKIWIAEVMLQQTTVQAVIPYYSRFLKAFPNIQSLAKSSIEKVLPYWSGLGYYSRVHNIHKSAQLFLQNTNGKIPKHYIELEQYPGFGPYTSRAVTSQSYNEPVSLLDGNVIRVLCRHQNWSHAWWKKSAQTKMLKKADEWRNGLPSGDMNQALMELGATICTPQSPSCSCCPIQKTCKGNKKNKIKQLPIKKIRKQKEILLWQPQIHIKNNKIFITQKHSCPFLKKQWLFPGAIKKMKNPPRSYDFRHSITHYDIYVGKSKKTKLDTTRGQWIKVKNISQKSPSSLIKKILSN